MIYRPFAADDLAAIWLDANDRQAVADSANAIDKQLGMDPLNAGESREGKSRVLCEGALIVFFDVDVQDQTVIVWGVNCQ